MSELSLFLNNDEYGSKLEMCLQSGGDLEVILFWYFITFAFHDLSVYTWLRVISQVFTYCHAQANIPVYAYGLLSASFLSGSLLHCRGHHCGHMS